MFTTLLAWIYITFISWMWGLLFLQLVKRISKHRLQLPHSSFVCFTGLSVITVIAGILSLFLPLGVWWIQFIFIAPCFFLFNRKNISSFLEPFKTELPGSHPASIAFLFACLLLVLVMSTWTIVHPDTLGYHAQTIQWIEKYKTVPGLVHLHVRFGYQGMWFVDCALFGFSFTGTEGIIFLNSTVLVWFFIFVINRINFNFFKEGKKTYGLLWTSLLFVTLWSYTQVRLTATSASPDFIATLFILSIIYLLLRRTEDNLAVWFTAAFLTVVAITIKLSAAPFLLIAAAALIVFLNQRKITLFITLLIISAVSFFPFITRNIITSGYVVFPSTSIDIADVDWKYSAELTSREKNYITAYAKKPGVTTQEDIDSVNRMSVTGWLPGWWQKRSLADKVIMATLLVSFLVAVLSIKNISRAGSIFIIILLTLLAGLIFWLINAPDPRFGFGAILGFIAVVTYLKLKDKEIPISKTMVLIILGVFTAGTLAYAGYRFINFFDRDQLLVPLGVEKTSYDSFECEGIRFNSPHHDQFGITPIPCTDLDCEKLSPRGNKVEDGFQAK